MIPYRDLRLPASKGKPFVYSNFVQTIDGKTQVKGKPNNHWPIGSRADYQGLLELRARADVLIHGRKTAEWVRTIDYMGQRAFQQLRTSRGQTGPILYIVISANPNRNVLNYLSNPPDGVQTMLVTTEEASLDDRWRSINVVRLPGGLVSASDVVSYLAMHGYRSILVEGGPTLLRHFLDKEQLDELFVTIAPKIFGGSSAETLSLVSGSLYAATDIRLAKLKDVTAIGDELYIRYGLKKGGRHES